ncbi:MAG: aldo/keto reductase family protein [Actinomycetia bacterium]|nr:aldo/keto reductase family protein [Actinomycetes bacterium]MCH9801009.1 aldo/keto reductase family protein [Actinomycetes bacterium]
MEHRHLGSSGLKVSELAYGNWITHASQIEQKQAEACVHAALDAGITTFDTADVYAGTRAEEVLGHALKEQRRDGLEICTKVYWPTGPGPNDVGLSRKHILRSCEGSLQRLGTDYIDLYQAHRFDVATPLEETMRAFNDLVRSGKVMYIGVSEWTAGQIRAALRIADDLGLDRIVSNQPQYSMLWRVIESDVVPVCEENGIGQIVWSPLAQGVLTGKYRPGVEPPKDSRAQSKEGSYFIKRWLDQPGLLERVQQLGDLAKQTDLSLPQLALAWVLNQPGVSAAIIGASRPEQVHENIRAVGVQLDEQLLKAIDDLLADAIITDTGLTRSPEQRP